MKKLIAVVGLMALSFYFFSLPEIDTDIFIDQVALQKSAVKKVKTPPPKKVLTRKKVRKVTKDSDKKEIVGEILETTSTSNSLKSIDYIIDDRLREAQEYLSPEQYGRLEKVLKKHFDGTKIVKRITEHLAKNLSLKELKDLQERTEDPFLTKVWSLEEYANSPEGVQAFEEFQANPTEERLALIKEFDLVAGGTDSVVELNSAIVRGILEGSNSSMPKDQRMNLDQITELTATLAEQIRDGLDDKVVNNLLFTYQDLSDDELSELVERGQDNLFSKANLLIQDKLKKILLEGGREIGRTNVHLN
ncbi:MAG: hypothetical protein E2O68_05860 [Deltaproteobacteria bacterium]|nr:MAG: hypothetical protein E2O68_05860 [Deltaproteobacteria bacterium]